MESAIVAGMLAAINGAIARDADSANTTLGFVNPFVYQHAALFLDITKGDPPVLPFIVKCTSCACRPQRGRRCRRTSRKEGNNVGRKGASISTMMTYNDGRGKK